MSMFPRPTLIWLSIGVAGLYWVVESAADTFIFNHGPLKTTLLGSNDLNEIQMRLLAMGLFVALGCVGERMVRTERRIKQNAQRLDRMLRFVEQVKQTVQGSTSGQPSSPVPERDSHSAVAPAAVPLDPASLRCDLQPANRISPSSEDVFEKLARMLQDLSWFLDVRFKELYAMMELAAEINSGMLLDEVLEKSYLSLRSVIPYNRLSLALLDADGRAASARWVKSDGLEVVLGKGYCAPLLGSSLQRIITSGEPRIINDLAGYLVTNPCSASTRLMVAEGIHSSLTCPLIILGKPIGFLFFSSRNVDVYKNVHVDIFRMIARHLSIVVEKSNLYQQVLQEKEKSETLLLNVMPARIAARLKAGEENIAENLADAGVLFADIVNFTDFASRYRSDRVVQVLQELFGQFDQLCDAHGVEKVKTIGDCYMAICTPLGATLDEPARQLSAFALAILRVAQQTRYPDGQPVNLRIGMHIGPVVAGVIGQKKFFYDIWGDTVNVASRMQSTGEPGRIQVSDEFRVQLGNEFVFERRGELNVKGKGSMMTYYLTARNDAILPASK